VLIRKTKKIKKREKLIFFEKNAKKIVFSIFAFIFAGKYFYVFKIGVMYIVIN